MAWPEVGDGGKGLQVLWVPASILNKQLQRVDGDWIWGSKLSL
jgi:hypothetical protein